MGSRIRL